MMLQDTDAMDHAVLASPIPSRLANRRIAILVAGMHRSGTSLLANLLTRLGAELPRKRLGPGRGNPLGHWEPSKLVALNDRILTAFGRDAADPRPMPADWLATAQAETFVADITRRITVEYGDAPLLLVKDPRLCRLLPLYAMALDRLDIEARVILCLRHPIEVACSLAARDGADPVAAELLWARLVIEAEAHSRSHPRAWTSFDALLGDSASVVGALGRGLGFAWRGVPADVAAIARAEHRHWAGPERTASRPAAPFLLRIWQAARLGLAGQEADARALFDESRALLQDFDRYNTANDQRLDAVYASTSWRVTAPLRWIKRMVATL